MKSYFNYFFLLFTAVALIGCNPSDQSGEDHPTGLDTERMGQIDSVINQAIMSGEIHGAVGLVAIDGNIEYHRSNITRRN